MFEFSKSTVALVATLLSLGQVAFSSQVIPCALGSGTQNGCSYCSNTTSIDVTPWSSATSDTSFNLPDAASKTGGGYDVWWDVPQPDPGCRVLLMQPYTTDKGSVNSALAGNVIMSTAHGGCYYAHVGSGGVSAAFCCGSGDCGKAGALPARKKRDVPVSRINRELHPSKLDGNALKERSWGPTNNPPPAPAPAPAAPAWTCSAPTPNGDTYTKAGQQQVDGNTLSCNGGESCDMSPVMSVSASDSLTNEKSTTITNSQGVSVEATAGWMLLGPMASVTVGASEDWSTAVTDALSESKSTTVTKTLTLSIGLVPGANFNLWFTPTLKCQSFTTNCNGADVSIEKCNPVLDGNGNPVGDHGVMTIG